MRFFVWQMLRQTRSPRRTSGTDRGWTTPQVGSILHHPTQFRNRFRCVFPSPQFSTPESTTSLSRTARMKKSYILKIRSLRNRQRVRYDAKLGQLNPLLAQISKSWNVIVICFSVVCLLSWLIKPGWAASNRLWGNDRNGRNRWRRCSKQREKGKRPHVRTPPPRQVPT